ncbi:N-acetylmuramoyl-L-alanine amidase family protein [Paenibacillus lignilyticus]|uniref:N-acetylmuramoyl-L-alanine amidase n=1 Tax=Paenibacillus lignilyticus TaxID=1172615 RepID=A0ABS5CEF7_9BACL|nr:N-acetylmuramoyl-L-alanine amidase [Paenibacillus lignilyticus]MBP3964137.1 N-acetylmuramoyl-L-alanine amidase [Paenibacillus lignilyticus]
MKRRKKKSPGTALLALIVFAAALFIFQAHNRANGSSDNNAAEGEPIVASQNLLLAGKTIVLDAGHGGKDAGSIGQQGTFEKDVTLQTVLHIRDELVKRTGAKVILTRPDDETVSLDERVEIANNSNADVFVSIHYDAFESNDVAGMTTYYYNDADSGLAELMHSELVKSIDVKDRGVKVGNYQVIRENTRPALLLELGYISNHAEEERMQSAAFQETVSSAIASGIIDYLS